MAIGRPGVITALQLMGLLLTVPLMTLLVPRYGIVGAGTALLLSTTSRFIFVLMSFPIFLKMPVPHVLPKQEDFAYLCRAIVKWTGLLGEKPLRAAEEMES